MNNAMQAAAAAGIEGAGLIEFGWIRVTGCIMEKTGKPLLASKNHHGCHLIEIGCAVLVTNNGEIWCKVGDFSEEELLMKGSTTFHPGLTEINNAIYSPDGIIKAFLIERAADPTKEFY